MVTPFRAAYNYWNPEKKHPLASLIETEGGNVDNVNFVTIHYELKDVSRIEKGTQNDNPLDLQFAQEKLITGTVLVALKRLPREVRRQRDERTEYRDYVGEAGEKNGPWNSTSGSGDPSQVFS